MVISSTAFLNGQPIPPIYTCSGDNVNPPITIEGIPDNTQSLVLIVDDPDAPSGTWTHWLVWNISGGTKDIAENSIPFNAKVGTNDFGDVGYSGPCPPTGTHRYFFRVYALDTVLMLPPTTRRVDLDSAIRGHALTQAELMGTYTKQS